ncbi:phage tail fiber protein [Enterobacter soli]|nr:phage tail fiber protein [Enterobacter soli]
MSVPNQTPYIIYNANGMTTVFPFEFYVINAGDIQVTVNGTVVTSGFSVSGVGNVGGGDVVFVTPPANGAVVMLERVVPTYRLTDYQDNGDLLADTVNKDFDRLWMAIQRAFIYLGLALRRPLFGGPFDAQGYRIANLGDPINLQDAATKNYVDNVSLVRTLRVPEASVSILPPVDQRANKLLAFNAAGQPIVVLPASGSASDVMIELAKPDGEKFIGECQTIAMLRTIEPTYDKQQVTLREHTAGTGKGGGQFRSVLAGSSYTDNNGTIIKTAGGAVWLRIDAEVTNPLMFGALCVSSVSDHAALMAASDASEVMDGLGLTYYVNSTVLWNLFVGRRVRRNFKIRAMASLPDGVPIIRTGNMHFIDNFTIDGSLQTTGSGNFGITWEGGRSGDGGAITNGDIRYTGASAIYISGDYSTFKFAGKGFINNINFVSCGTRGSGNGRVSLLTDGISNFTISNITGTDCNWGIYIRNDLGVSGLSRASNNVLSKINIKGGGRPSASRPDAQGISASYQDNLQISDVTISDFADNGIDMQYCNASIVAKWRVTNCKDGLFMGDRDCSRHVISEGISVDCDRGLRLVTDGSFTTATQLAHIKIRDVHAFNVKFEGFRFVNTGKALNARMYDVQFVDCSCDASGTYTLSTQTYGMIIQGASNFTVCNFNTYNVRLHGIYVKDSEIVKIVTGTHENTDRSGTGSYGVCIENDCVRVTVSETTTYGSSTAGAVLLAGGAGHSVKHTRWRGTANGVSSSAAIAPYLLDNTSF